MQQTFNQIVKRRRALRIFDQKAPFNHEAVAECLELAVLAPNSSNLQLWEFYRIKSPEMLQKFVPVCLDQNAAKTARELVAVVCRTDKWNQRRRDVYQQIVENMGEKAKNSGQAKLVNTYYNKLIPIVYRHDPFGLLGMTKKAIVSIVGIFKPSYRQVSKADVRIISHKSAALAAQTFMLGMTAHGYDTCPMEGLDSSRAKKLLNLPMAAEINMIIAIGPGAPEGLYGPRLRRPNWEILFEV